MNTSHESAQPQTTIARLPLWLRLSGAPIFIGSAMLSARIIWEQTVWTWEQGPQMIGFSLAHGPGAILLPFPFLLIMWTVLVVVLTVRSKLKKTRITPARWVALGLAMLVLILGQLPDGFWQRVFMGRMAASPQAGDLLVHAAYRGDLGTVRDFISHGIPVDAINHSDWRTAMHAAAVTGDLRMARYLTSKGANIDAVDRSGDSPLELAVSKGNEAAASFLTRCGAKRIRGDEAQRQKAIDDEVSEATQSLK